MASIIQMRGRYWPDSMGWQDTGFQPEDCSPAEWVSRMNHGDPQIEYRLAPLVDGRVTLVMDSREAGFVVRGLRQLAESLSDDVAFGSAAAERDRRVVHDLLRRLS